MLESIKLTCELLKIENSSNQNPGFNSLIQTICEQHSLSIKDVNLLLVSWAIKHNDADLLNKLVEQGINLNEINTHRLETKVDDEDLDIEDGLDIDLIYRAVICGNDDVLLALLDKHGLTRPDTFSPIQLNKAKKNKGGMFKCCHTFNIDTVSEGLTLGEKEELDNFQSLTKSTQAKAKQAPISLAMTDPKLFQATRTAAKCLLVNQKSYPAFAKGLMIKEDVVKAIYLDQIDKSFIDHLLSENLKAFKTLLQKLSNGENSHALLPILFDKLNLVESTHPRYQELQRIIYQFVESAMKVGNTVNIKQAFKLHCFDPSLSKAEDRSKLLAVAALFKHEPTVDFLLDDGVNPFENTSIVCSRFNRVFHTNSNHYAVTITTMPISENAFTYLHWEYETSIACTQVHDSTVSVNSMSPEEHMASMRWLLRKTIGKHLSEEDFNKTPFALTAFRASEQNKEAIDWCFRLQLDPKQFQPKLPFNRDQIITFIIFDAVAKTQSNIAELLCKLEDKAKYVRLTIEQCKARNLDLLASLIGHMGLFDDQQDINSIFTWLFECSINSVKCLNALKKRFPNIFNETLKIKGKNPLEYAVVSDAPKACITMLANIYNPFVGYSKDKRSQVSLFEESIKKSDQNLFDAIVKSERYKLKAPQIVAFTQAAIAAENSVALRWLVNLVQERKLSLPLETLNALDFDNTASHLQDGLNPLRAMRDSIVFKQGLSRISSEVASLKSSTSKLELTHSTLMDMFNRLPEDEQTGIMLAEYTTLCERIAQLQADMATAEALLKESSRQSSLSLLDSVKDKCAIMKEQNQRLMMQHKALHHELLDLDTKHQDAMNNQAKRIAEEQRALKLKEYEEQKARELLDAYKGKIKSKLSSLNKMLDECSSFEQELIEIQEQGEIPGNLLSHQDLRDSLSALANQAPLRPENDSRKSQTEYMEALCVHLRHLAELSTRFRPSYHWYHDRYVKVHANLFKELIAFANMEGVYQASISEADKEAKEAKGVWLDRLKLSKLQRNGSFSTRVENIIQNTDITLREINLIRKKIKASKNMPLIKGLQYKEELESLIAQWARIHADSVRLFSEMKEDLVTREQGVNVPVVSSNKPQNRHIQACIALHTLSLELNHLIDEHADPQQFDIMACSLQIKALIQEVKRLQAVNKKHFTSYNDMRILRNGLSHFDDEYSLDYFRNLAGWAQCLSRLAVCNPENTITIDTNDGKVWPAIIRSSNAYNKSYDDSIGLFKHRMNQFNFLLSLQEADESTLKKYPYALNMALGEVLEVVIHLHTNHANLSKEDIARFKSVRDSIYHTPAKVQDFDVLAEKLRSLYDDVLRNKLNPHAVPYVPSHPGA